MRVSLDGSLRTDTRHLSKRGSGILCDEHGCVLDPGEQGLMEALGKQLGFAYIDCTDGLGECAELTTQNHDASEMDREQHG